MGCIIYKMAKSVKIFWQETCPNCPPAKSLGKKLEGDGVKVEYYNIREVDGLSEAAFYDVMATPSVVVAGEEGREVKAWRNSAPAYSDVKELL